MKLTASVYTHLVESINRYFKSEARWKFDEDTYEFKYHKKPKRNLKELEMITDVVFSCEAEIVEKGLHRNLHADYIGAYVILKFFVHPDFNGVHQGSGDGEYVYLELDLYDNVFSTHQSQHLANLIDRQFMIAVR